MLACPACPAKPVLAMRSSTHAAVQAKWNATEEKPAVIAIGLSSFVAIWAASGLVDAINRLPLINGLLEGVGLVVTGWFVYRNLIFGPDRCAFCLRSLRECVTGKQVRGSMHACQAHSWCERLAFDPVCTRMFAAKGCMKTPLGQL